MAKEAHKSDLKKVEQKPDDNDVENYNKVVEVAELNGVQLIKLNFEVEPAFFKDAENNELRYNVEVLQTHYDAAEKFAACLIRCNVHADREEEQVLSCEAEYSVSYSIDEECNKDSVDKFLRRVGPFACYPYFRTQFSNLDWAANTRLPILPVHKEAKPVKSEPKRKRRKPSSD